MRAGERFAAAMRSRPGCDQSTALPALYSGNRPHGS
jgi:hypothetical protein